MQEQLQNKNLKIVKRNILIKNYNNEIDEEDEEGRASKECL